MEHPSAADESMDQVRFAAWVGLVADLVLSALKLAAGVAGHSRAVVADAVHSLTDVVTDLAVLLGMRYWSAPADELHPHGHRRFETLVTVGIGICLAAVAVGVAWETVGGPSYFRQHPPTGIALGAAVLSIVGKEALFRWTRAVGRRTGSFALIANAWHHRSDALSSLPAAAGVTAAMLMPGWAVADRLGAAVVSVFVLHAAWQILRPALAQLADEGVPAEQRRRLETLAVSVDGVRSAHALRTRYLGSKLAVDLHVEVDGELSVEKGYGIARAVRRELLERGPDVVDVLVQVEPHGHEHPSA